MTEVMIPDDTVAELFVSVSHCARCELDHEHLAFKRFVRPVLDEDGVLWTHWAMCPVARDPILMRIAPPRLLDEKEG